MKIAVFGGSFNPPHLGHRSVVEMVSEHIQPDLFLIIPDNVPPHKELEEGSPDSSTRLRMCIDNFSELPGVQVSDMEIQREGRSYTADTVKALRDRYPTDTLMFVMGTDMLLSFEEWNHFEYLLKELELIVLSRFDNGDDQILGKAQALKDQYNAVIHFIDVPPMPMSSSQIRALLKERKGNDLLNDSVYTDIIRARLYSAQINLSWLEKKIVPLHKPKRLRHVYGVREEASRLADRWGVDPQTAEEAGLLHDVTKKLDTDGQLLLADKYGIIISDSERENPKLLHAITGSEYARREFGVSQEVCDAIRWHTTGRPEMTMLEKVIYLADCIEPNRTYPGVEDLRAACYDDIDKAMCIALKMSINVVRERGDVLHAATLEAYEWYRRKGHS